DLMGARLGGQYAVGHATVDSPGAVDAGPAVDVHYRGPDAGARLAGAGHRRPGPGQASLRRALGAGRSRCRSRRGRADGERRGRMIATTLILLLVLIGISIPVGAALGVLGLILDPLYSMLPLTRAIGEISWSANNEFLLVAIPLFIMLGEVLLRSGFAERMY